MTCHFIPPYLLRQLATKAGDERVGPSPQSTLEVDEAFRLHRTTAARGLQTAVAPSTADRIIHTANNTQTLPGEVARTDEQPPVGDLAVDEAWDSSAQVWDLFDQIFGRASMDGQGTTLSVTVHYGVNYDNAFWDGQQLVFGDGDGKIFDRFTKPMDVLAHEFTHGVTQFTAALGYQDQPGALNESVSDVFAAMTKQRALDQTADQADWLIGEGLFLPSVKAIALRSMKDPGTAYDDPLLGKDPQVGSMADYVDTNEDNGGVHLNSGIPNRAFALASIAVGGRSWDQTGKAWYDALTGGEVNSTTDFAGFAQATINSSTRLFGADSAVTQQISAAWTEVGVLGARTAPAQPETDGAGAPTDGPLPVTKVAVKRTGGFAGHTRTGELDLLSDPQGEEVRNLLLSVDLQDLLVSPPTPDRFTYTVEYGQSRLVVPEQDLTPELDRVVRMVLGD
ncbi:MAG: family metallopeptidase [Propionibacteriaceae bacterium]|jgi:Zn-dependent metalloprotease|nr:family metallopeptidase [Propionibacteriaceae bacterium]